MVDPLPVSLTPTGRPASWVVVCRSTGRAVLETWSAATVCRVNLARYEVVPILEWLQRVNATRPPDPRTSPGYPGVL